MTHFIVAIITPPDERDDIDGFISQQMDRYDENGEVESYVSYSLEQAAAQIERDKAFFKRIIERKEPDYDLKKCRKLLKAVERLTPEEKYREYLKYQESFNDKGEPVSTRNPDARWDWYRIGGRWDGWIIDNEKSSDGGFNFGKQHESIANNSATTQDMLARNKIPHAIITPDGEWHEHGHMGWWGIMQTENDNWEQEAKRILAQFPDHIVVTLDAHI